MKTVKFGIIGCGLMGREFASASARWCHLTDPPARPEIVALCDANPSTFDWFTGNFSSVQQTTNDYTELLANDEVEGVYVAVPHNLHEEVYTACIRAGKHLFAEKPFGIDLPACEAIVACMKQHPSVLVRCCSQFPFFPAMQQLGVMVDQGVFGRILEVEAGFLHSSDLDPTKPINWKRMLSMNGEYGVMGDLGMHVCHIPFRAGWTPKNVRGILSNIMTERPDKSGAMVPCETWDNATLLCEAEDPGHDRLFPLTLKTQRIAPGESNTWYLNVMGDQACARFTTRYPTVLQVLEYRDKKQEWRELDLGYKPAFSAITGGIFEFGFSDAIQQMWASYLYELENGKPLARFAGVATPDEALLSHKLFTAALESQKTGNTVKV